VRYVFIPPFPICYALFVFFPLTAFNETAESANDVCRSGSSETEDIFADSDDFDINKVWIFISYLWTVYMMNLILCNSGQH